MSRTASETRQVEAIASSYEGKGYEVVRDPRRADLPTWLGDLRVDLIARREGDCVLVEVKSARALRGEDRFRALAARVDEHPEWRLELVVTGPGRQTADEHALPPPVMEPFEDAGIRDYRAAATVLLDQDLVGPAFVAAWSAFEAAYRRAFRRDGVEPDGVSQPSALKTLLSLGYLQHRDELGELEALWKTRNSVAHGYETASPVSRDAVMHVLALTDRLLAPSQSFDE